MSTKQTQNYGLHLWEPQDKFLRTEFNENSTKLDTALKAHDTRMDGLASTIAGKSAFTLIRTQTSSADSSTFSISMAGVDWSQWNLVVIRLRLKGAGQMTISPNASNSGTFYQVGGMGATSFGLCAPSLDSTETDYTLVLPCSRDSSRYLESFFYGSGTFTSGYSRYAYANVSTLDLNVYRSSGSLTLYAGCRAEIYGVR